MKSPLHPLSLAMAGFIALAAGSLSAAEEAASVPSGQQAVAEPPLPIGDDWWKSSRMQPRAQSADVADRRAVGEPMPEGTPAPAPRPVETAGLSAASPHENHSQTSAEGLSVPPTPVREVDPPPSMPLEDNAVYLPAQPGVGFDPDVGIFFIRPFWSKRDFSISLPGSNGTGGLILADTRDVTNDYTVSPTFKLDVKFGQMEFAISGIQYQLNSSTNQGITSAAGTATLTATSSLALQEARMFQPTFPVPTPDYLRDCLEETIPVGLGPFYLHLTQDYSATLANGAQTALLTSHQNFEGVGIVASVDLTSPDLLSERSRARDSGWSCRWYSFLQGAAVLGQNNRKSDFAPSSGAKLSVFDNKTDLIPFGSIELGVEFRKNNMFTLRGSPGMNIPGALRVGVMGQVLGDVGLPSAQSMSSRALENGALYLVGVGAAFELKGGARP